MTPFIYQKPGSVAQAVEALAASGSGGKVMAGGQSLLLALKERQVRPAQIVSVGKLAEMSGVTYAADGTLAIGAATTYAALTKADLTGWHQALAEVAGNLADRSVRNIGTIGGGVCQADPRYDMPTFLSAVAASFELRSSRATRVLAASEFFNPAGGTHIAADELLIRIILPPLATWSRVAFAKYRFRTFEAATGLVGGAVKLDEAGTIEGICLAVGAVGKAPSIAVGAEAKLIGRRVSDVNIDEVAVQISHEVLPPDSARTRQRKYLSELTISLAKRMLNQLAGAAP